MNRIKVVRDCHPYVAGDLLVATNIRVKELVPHGFAVAENSTPDLTEPALGDLTAPRAARKAKA